MCGVKKDSTTHTASDRLWHLLVSRSVLSVVRSPFASDTVVHSSTEDRLARRNLSVRERERKRERGQADGESNREIKVEFNRVIRY